MWRDDGACYLPREKEPTITRKDHDRTIVKEPGPIVEIVGCCSRVGVGRPPQPAGSPRTYRGDASMLSPLDAGKLEVIVAVVVVRDIG